MANVSEDGNGYQHGLHELGNGCFGYLQPDGSWGSVSYTHLTLPTILRV